MNKQTLTLSAVSVLLASLALTGCNKRDDVGTVAKNPDNTAVVTGQPTAGDSAVKATEDAKK